MRMLVWLLVAGCVGGGPGKADTDVAGDTDTTGGGTIGDTDTDPPAPLDTAWPEPTGLPTTGLCSADGWCWVEPAPHGLDLTAVDGTGPDDVWAVGGAGLVQRFDGTDWTFELLDDATVLEDVVVDVVGEPCVGGWGGVLRCRRDGAWHDEAPPGEPNVRALDRAPGGDLWVAASDGVLQQTASGWVSHAGGASFVVALADDDVWVAADAAMEVRHFDGEGWRSIALPSRDHVHGLAGAPGVGVWVDGELAFYRIDVDQLVAEPSYAHEGLWHDPLVAVLHDGTVVSTSDIDRSVRAGGRWHRALTGTPDLSTGAPPTWWWGAEAVWCADLDDCFVVGDRGLVRRWDGVDWERHGGPIGDDLGYVWSGLAVAAPWGGVIWGAGLTGSPYRWRSGDLREPFPLAGYPEVTGLVADGPRVWAVSNDVDEGAWPPGDGHRFASWRDVRGRWHDVRDGVWDLRPSADPGKVWIREDDADCRWRELDVTGQVSDLWPPDVPAEVGCDAVAWRWLVAFDPPDAAWWVGTSIYTTTTDLLGYEGGTWHHAVVEGHVGVARHPLTGDTVILTEGAGVGHLDGDTVVVDVVLGEPGDRGGTGALRIGDELMLEVRPRIGPPVLVWWNGTTVRREALPVQLEVGVLRDVDGRAWAFSGDDLLVRVDP